MITKKAFSLLPIIFILTACSGGGSSDTTTPTGITSYTIGGDITGLQGSGLTLQNNAGDDLNVNNNGSFVFSTAINSGNNYNVTVLSQPGNPTQVCSVSNGNNTVNNSNVTNVSVTCITPSYTVGGTVSGLIGDGLVLQNNGGDDLPINNDGSFEFANHLNESESYSITVLTQPTNPDQVCNVNNDSGAISNSDISNLQVDCINTHFSVGINVSGLLGTGLILQNNGGDNLAISNNGDFSFTTLQNNGSTYNVTVLTQPTSPDQTCNLLNASGTINSSNVNNIQLSCVSNGTGNVLVGRFLAGSVVSGVHYETASQSGMTNGNGEFNYMAGETVSFSIGNILLGEAQADAIVTPFSLMGITAPQSAIDIRSAFNLASSRVHVTELEQVSNLAVFLHTLDVDSDASNGIDIDTQLHSLAASSTLHFNHKRNKFAQDYAFRVLMADARNAGLWGGTRAIRNRAYAMDDLYDALGITATIYATQVSSGFNYLGDPTQIVTHIFDSRGHEITSEFDNDSDGTPESASSWEYDNNGNEVKRILNGSSYATISVYDSNGLKIQEGVDTDLDDTMDQLNREYSYDIYGSMTVDDYFASNLVTNKTYDANGNLTISETDYNGSPNTRITYTYDSNNLLTDRHQENFGASTTISIHSYVYNANDLLIEDIHDSDGDGVFNSHYIYDYDADENRTLVEFDAFIDDPMFPVDYRDTYTYDSRGNILRIEHDYVSDGNIESANINTYDAIGNQTLHQSDLNGDGVIESYTSSVYNADGSLIFLEQSYGINNTGNYSASYTPAAINRWSAIRW